MKPLSTIITFETHDATKLSFVPSNSLGFFYTLSNKYCTGRAKNWLKTDHRDCTLKSFKSKVQRKSFGSDSAMLIGKRIKTASTQKHCKRLHNRILKRMCQVKAFSVHNVPTNQYSQKNSQKFPFQGEKSYGN